MGETKEKITDTPKDTAKPKHHKKYNKDRLLTSKTYIGDIDLLEALLEDNKTYTKSEVDDLIIKYKESEVD